MRDIQDHDHADILRLVAALPDWFDQDARDRSIPIDLRYQDGLVAVSDGEIIGFLTLYVGEGRLNIGWMGVRPDWHRKGVGTRLLERAEEIARQRSLTEIATCTLGDGVDYEPYEATRAFYFNRGFVVYQRNRTDNPGCPEEIRIKKAVLRA